MSRQKLQATLVLQASTAGFFLFTDHGKLTCPTLPKIQDYAACHLQLVHGTVVDGIGGTPMYERCASLKLLLVMWKLFW